MEKGVLHTSSISDTFEKMSVIFFPEGRKEEGEGRGEETNDKFEMPQVIRKSFKI